jgi:hypothetical protein
VRYRIELPTPTQHWMLDRYLRGLRHASRDLRSGGSERGAELRLVTDSQGSIHRRHAARTTAPATTCVCATRARVFPSAICTDTQPAHNTKQWPSAGHQGAGPARRHTISTSYSTKLDRIKSQAILGRGAMGAAAVAAQCDVSPGAGRYTAHA